VGFDSLSSSSAVPELYSVFLGNSLRRLKGQYFIQSSSDIRVSAAGVSKTDSHSVST
jgi:hypothetical protein